MHKIKLSGFQLQVLISLCMYMGLLLLGFTISWSGPMIPKLQDLDQSPLSHKLTDTQVSLTGSLLYIGSIPGSYLVGWLSNFKGRKPCLLLGSLISMIGYILLLTTRNVPMLFIGRLLTGFSVGCIFLVVFVYLGEIASTSRRGTLLAIAGIFSTLSSMSLFSSATFFSYRGTTSVGLTFNIIFILGLLMIPESPMFHVLKGDDNAVKKTLQDLDRLDDLEKLIAAKQDYRTISNIKDWRDLFTLRNNRKALFRLTSINIFQQCSGVMAIMFFFPRIFELSGSKIEGNLGMIIIGCFQLMGSTVTPIFIEKIGRKVILTMSCAICSLSMFTLGLYFYLLDIENPGIQNVHWLPLVVLIFFFLGFDSGLAIIPSVLIGEMFTPNVRSCGSTLTITVSGLIGFLVTIVFGTIVNKVGPFVPFWFFSCTSALAFLFTIFFIPETKGKSLLEIQMDLGKK
ncbi:facilitated trehalose transporter Tret1-like [Danaus plexippus]|uniref:facilitated trehalose transporter Tret1-like n=1 Tax=Danaus plexippus TaxID=13037 RepID=UPI002AB283BC|nr:facilitated trehalose transporter Tret1-like [Danaus plexippus]